MTNAISLNHAAAIAATPLDLRPGKSTEPSTSTYKSVPNGEDSVELSATAQQYLATQSGSPPGQGMVAQLVRAAAAGDTGALSLLTVI